MAYTADQIQEAIAKAQAAGDSSAVRELQAMLPKPAGGAGRAAPGATPTPTASTAPEGAQTFQRAGDYGPFMAGVAGSAIKGALGIKQFFGGLSKEDQQVLKEIAAEEHADPNKGWRTAGGVTGDIAASAALPMGGTLKGAVSAASKLTPVMRAALQSGAQTAILSPVDTADNGLDILTGKLKEGAKAAATTAALGGTIRALGGVFRPTVDARKLAEQGINVTLAEGADGGAGKLVAGLTSGIVNPRRRLNNELGDAITKRATEGNVSAKNGTGSEVAEFMGQHINDEYNALWNGKKAILTPDIRAGAADVVSKLPKDAHGADEALAASKVFSNRMGQMDRRQPFNATTFIDEYRNPITAEAFSDTTVPEVRRRLLAGRQYLDETVLNPSLSGLELLQKKGIDRRNFDLERVKEVTGGGKGSLPGVDTNALNAAYDNMRSQAAAIGNTTLDDLVAPLARSVDRAPAQHAYRALINTGKLMVGAGAMSLAPAAAIPLYGASAIGQTGQGAKALMGLNEWQQALVEALRKKAAQHTMASVGSGLTPDPQVTLDAP